jgi:hypothetical protein
VAASSPEDPVVIAAPHAMHAVTEGVWRFSLDGILAAVASDLEIRGGSRLELKEDDVPLGPAHSEPESIAGLGGGAWSHRGRRITFSTSDGSDPRSNGRVYSLAVAEPATHEYADPRVGEPPVCVPRLQAPELVCESPRDARGRLTTARPRFVVHHPDPGLRWFFELDTVATFDSPRLQRRPRIGIGVGGVDPLHLIDRDPELGPVFEPGFRLGALAPQPLESDDPALPRMLALRLGHGLTDRWQMVREVYSYVHEQLYPFDTTGHAAGVRETLRRQRGMCYPSSLLTQRLLMELGFRTRSVSANSSRLAPLHRRGAGLHWSCEVFLDGGWSVVDPWFQFLLPGVSWERIHTDDGVPPRVAYTLAPGPDHDGLLELEGASDEALTMMLREFAELRAYDHPDAFAAVSADVVEEEALLFAGSPAHVPDPPFERLWPQPELELHLRVRGLRIDQAQFSNRALNLAAAHPPPARIQGTPWVTTSVVIDLAQAYTARA